MNNIYLICLTLFNFVLFTNLQKVRAESEKNKIFFEELPIVHEAIRTNSNDAIGQESVLFADKWFYKEDLQVRVRL